MPSLTALTARTTLRLVAATVVACSWSWSAAAAPVDLAPRFRKGDEGTYRYVVESKMAMGVMGQTHLQAAHHEADLNLKVVEVGEDSVRLDAEFTRLKINLEGGLAPGSFDSTSPARQESDDVYEQICRPMVGRPITVVATPDGEITAIEGLEALRPSDMAGVLFDQLFGDDVIISMIQPILRIKSDGEPVNVRDSWEETTTSVRSLNIMPAAVTLRLESHANNLARVQFEGSLISKPDEVQELPNTQEKESIFKGECLWDTMAGRMKSMNSESTLRLLSEAQGISVTVDIESSTSLKRVN